MKLQLHDNAINNELWQWVATLENDVKEITIANIDTELKIVVSFECGRIHLVNDGLKITHNIYNQTQKLLFNGIIIEKDFIFENEYELKHYPFLDQFLLNGTYVDLALNLENIVNTFGGIE